MRDGVRLRYVVHVQSAQAQAGGFIFAGTVMELCLVSEGGLPKYPTGEETCTSMISFNSARTIGIAAFSSSAPAISRTSLLQRVNDFSCRKSPNCSRNTGIYRGDDFYLAGGMRVSAYPHGVFVSRDSQSQLNPRTAQH